MKRKEGRCYSVMSKTSTLVKVSDLDLLLSDDLRCFCFLHRTGSVVSESAVHFASEEFYTFFTLTDNIGM